MEEKLFVDEPGLQDKGPMYDNEGLIDLLIIDCNSAVQAIVSGGYIAFCRILTQMVQKLSNLKKSVHNDRVALENQIKDLKKIIEENNKAEGE